MIFQFSVQRNLAAVTDGGTGRRLDGRHLRWNVLGEVCIAPLTIRHRGAARTLAVVVTATSAIRAIFAIYARCGSECSVVVAQKA